MFMFMFSYLLALFHKLFSNKQTYFEGKVYFIYLQGDAYGFLFAGFLCTFSGTNSANFIPSAFRAAAIKGIDG